MHWTKRAPARDKGQVTPIGYLKRLFGRGRRPAPDWRVVGRRPKGASSGIDFSEAWTLPQGEVAFLRSAGPREGIFAWRPDGGRTIAVSAGGLYRFSVLAAVHRCRAELVITLQDAAGRTLDEQRRGVSPAARGGRERSAYHAIEAEFRAPKGCERLGVAFRKGGAEPGQDSFLFVAEPRLEPVDDGYDLPAPAMPAPATPVAWAPHRASRAWNRRRDSEARRLAAHRVWLDRAARGEAIPDLAALEAVVAGEAQAAEPAFPPVEGPQATVLIEAVDDEALLRRSLAALRYAANAVDFEVMVAEAGNAAAAVAGARCELVVLMEAGWEPAAGWLDELIAASFSFETGAVAPRRLEAEGRLEGGGNPRDPRFGHVAPTAMAFPLMVRREDLQGADTAASVGALAEAAHRRL